LADLPENALVITVSVSLLLRMTSLCCSCALLSVVIKNALPNWIVAAPRHCAALKPLLSIIPPEAITGILTTSATCGIRDMRPIIARSEEHTSELQSRFDLVCRLLLGKKNDTKQGADDGAETGGQMAGRA